MLIYGMDADGAFSCSPSWDEGMTLSAGEAFFTQTSVIGDEETLTFAVPKRHGGSMTTAAGRMTKRLQDAAGGEDEVTVMALQDSDSDRISYCFGVDGAKFMAMNDSQPQIAACADDGVRMAHLCKAPKQT